MKKPKNTQLTTVMWLFLYLLVVWFAIILAGAYETGLSVFEYLPNITKAIQSPFELSYNDHTLSFILAFSLLYAISIATYYASESNRRIGEEHGSASWGNNKAIRKQFGQDKKTDRLFTKNVRMGLNSYKHRRNLNTLVIGGSGAGKTRFFAKPSALV